MTHGDFPDALEELIELLQKLPGIGRRGGARMALTLLRWQEDRLRALGDVLSNLHRKVGYCPECGALADKGEKCRICRMPGRDRSLLCVVEEPQQIFAIEQSGRYRGLYHVLGGKLSPLENRNGEDLSTDLLKARVASGQFREVILALSADVEGRATAIYVGEMLKPLGVVISQPALGLPAGANLSYADAATISAALDGRREI